MSELEPQLYSGEHLKGVENSAEQKEKLNQLLKEAKEAHHEPAEHSELLRKTVEQEALTGKELQGKIGEKERPKQQHSNVAITKAAKKAAYRKTLSHVRQQLPQHERTFSKVIHQPVIERVSEIGAKTVARPSAILSGGICALIGSSIVFYMAKHYGFRYNFFVFILLLGIGFALGLFIELLWKGSKKLVR
jgi:ABC-type nickel/cobalt efflux system permease component RcnA